MNISTTATLGTPAATRDRQGQWLMIAGGVLLGTIGVFVEEAGQHPLVTVWFRCFFGALALVAWCLATGRGRELLLRHQARSRWVACATGVFMVLNWALFFAAIPRTSIAVATVIFHVQPIWVILFGALFLREAVSTSQWVATLVALGGLVLTTGLLNGVPAGTADGGAYVAGVLMCLGGSLCYAAVTLLASRTRQADPRAVSPSALTRCRCGSVWWVRCCWRGHRSCLAGRRRRVPGPGSRAWACCTQGWPTSFCLRAWRGWRWARWRCCSLCTRLPLCWWTGRCMAAR